MKITLLVYCLYTLLLAPARYSKGLQFLKWRPAKTKSRCLLHYICALDSNTNVQIDCYTVTYVIDVIQEVQITVHSEWTGICTFANIKYI